MYNLGWCYLKGEGVEKDEAEGTRWIRRAADLGDGTAKEALKRMTKNKDMPIPDKKD